jgi:hypothetical protein
LAAAEQRPPDAAAGTPQTSAGDNAAPPRARATGLRLEQTLGSSATPTSTVLGLRRQYNCFWISF